MKPKYMLVEVVDREIEGKVYDSYDKAAVDMQTAYEETLHCGDYGEITEWWAFVNSDPGGNNYDWKILEIPK